MLCWVMDELRTKWSTDAEGNDVPPTLQDEYINWILEGPAKVPSTKKEWAKLHQVPERSVYRWEKNHKFQRELRRRANAKNLSPDRLQDAIEVIYATMVDPETKTADRLKAATLYINYLEKLNPIKPVEDGADDDVSKLSDEQLAALLSRGAE